MPDITCCRSKNCPIREYCYRYTAKKDRMQSYFVDEKLFKIIKSGVICEHFLRNEKLTNREILKLEEDAKYNVKKLQKIGNKK